ncbi:MULTISPECIES: polyamine aminopropyltransferase [unclassified Sedimentibacter]|uniref:polyamine aminopropyltransferase n=1 Tax=unclassified Sedimentibacter TaxID=2649220 RepID=UPI0027E19812|nr:polyamine aminopropyltransferase [Sedimentibacter sp. MB35-C1]WMJ77387.1 polyamine aminopropyltransferase [Sedimentibacter sp. MB35-C1]
MELWFTEEHTDNVRFSVRVDKHIESMQSDFQKIDVFQTPEFGKVLVIDGFIMLTEKDEFIYHEMITHVPMAVNPSIKNILVIGAGDGGTVRELTRYSTVEKIDMVEIDKMVVDVCMEHIPQTASKLNDKRVNLFFEDGLKFVKAKTNEYDLIIVDSTDPIGPGVELFTQEFYKNCYNALKEDGILVNQHESPYYRREAETMQRTHKKIKSVFPVANVYQAHIPTYGSGHWLFGFASKKYDPVKNHEAGKWESLGISANYYNSNLHKGAFALPNYVIDLLNNAK